MDDLDPFDSPKLLVDGAKASIAQFETSCESFLQTCGYDIISHNDPQTGEKVFKFRFRQKIPGQLRVDASRIVNDLRHALDQAVCDAAIVLGRTDGRGVYFPFGKTAKNLDDECIARCKGVRPELVAFLRAFKAHYGGDDVLYALGALAGPNKHQRILQISLGSGGSTLYGQGFIKTGVDGEAKIGAFKWNDLRNELEFARISGTVDINLNMAHALAIIIGTGKSPLSGNAVAIFGQLASKIESIVLGIEAEAVRLKRVPAS